MINATVENRTAPEPDDEYDWIGAKDVARILAVPLKTVYHWLREGEGPPAHRFGKHWRYDRTEVRQWIREQRRGHLRSEGPVVDLTAQTPGEAS